MCFALNRSNNYELVNSSLYTYDPENWFKGRAFAMKRVPVVAIGRLSWVVHNRSGFLQGMPFGLYELITEEPDD